MAFAEGGKGTEYAPTCHGCGRKCKGGWRKCQHITDEHRAKVAALDDARHFRGNNNSTSGNKNKKGSNSNSNTIMKAQTSLRLQEAAAARRK